MTNIPKLAGAPNFGTLPTPEGSVAKRLEGKKILLTGTTKGVGKVAQELLCAHGAFVCGSGTTPGVADSVAAGLRAKGYKAEGFQADLGDYDQARAWVERCAEVMGGIDVVINNASKPEMLPFEQMDPESWRKSLRNELDIVYNVCHAAWPYLKEADGSSIIITSSTNGLQGSNSPQSAHAAAKGACLALARQLAGEGGPFGIRCNSITPGLIWTEAMANIPQEMATGLIAAQTTQQAIDPMDIAYAYLFLASDESRFITAANLPVDGGCAGAVTGGMQGDQKALVL
ncbi:MAG: SDR family NAD(P)-dependent oxidoreductase [Eggerthellales bacterium]|nr:SDR family NAD(P)-dependent oxidoreductase [Eggerthellales bacterium]